MVPLYIMVIVLKLLDNIWMPSNNNTHILHFMAQPKIYNVKPGLTGIGSIIFRDEESIISAVKD